MRNIKLRVSRGVLSLLASTIITLALNSPAFAAIRTTLWNFGPLNSDDGLYPAAALVRDASGNLYGTTTEGGFSNGVGQPGVGAVFMLTPPATKGGPWTESILWRFKTVVGDGYYPDAGLVMDKSGNLYGTTSVGGAYGASSAGGTVFELTPPATSGGDWTEKIIWSFGNGTDGELPEAGLIMDKAGDLYGTTAVGGVYYTANALGGTPGGTAFKLAPPTRSGGNWTESVLWNFGNGTDGSDPLAGLVMDQVGNLYGTTSGGGVYTITSGRLVYGLGTAFKLSPPATKGGAWSEFVLWNFGNGTDGTGPGTALTVDKSGNLYGTTDSGGLYDDLVPGDPGGTAFELTPPATGGDNWTESIFWNFGGGDDGQFPSDLIFDARGNLYGTSGGGGANGGGTAFEFTPPALSGEDWNESILVNFGANGSGKVPAAGLIMDPAHNLYGTTEYGGTHGGWGTVFRISNLGNQTPTP